MIAGFPREATVCNGDVLELCVYNDEPCAVRFARAGATRRDMREHAGFPIRDRGLGAETAAVPRRWPVHRFDIPQSWSPGVYVAMLEPFGSRERRLDARTGRALFVVRSRTPSSAILYNVPLFTYHAYNVGLDVRAERTCLYNSAPSVGLRRPGGGIGGHTWDESIADAYDPESPRQSFAHWDLRAIGWLESHGFAPDYCTDYDLHRDGERLLQDYRLIVAFGHHEYWSDAMRAALDAHVAAGRHAAFFTGNTCYFRIAVDVAARTISRLGRWDERPEERTFGVSYRFGGGKWRGERPAVAYVVKEPRHWLFDGSHVARGDEFGGEARLAGYECDGRGGEANECVAVAEADLSSWNVDDGSGECSANARASLCVREARGVLVCAGTVDWPRVLAAGEPVVERITQNAIVRLSRDP